MILCLYSPPCESFGGCVPLLSLMGNYEAKDHLHLDIILNCPQGLLTQ